MSSNSSPRIENGPNILRAWAALGAELLASKTGAVPDWSSLQPMIQAARNKLAGDAERLRKLLQESRKRLVPLEDPFDVDVGLHRWLDAEREEAYSDWLEWVVRQAHEPKKVFKLFALGSPPEDVVDCLEMEVQREWCVPQGHPDQGGRLDLVIRYGRKALIVVEVKKGDADEADTTKHIGYNQWLADQPYSRNRKYSVLLGLSGEAERYQNFRFLSWQSLCLEMRRLAADFCKDERVMRAAMILAFVAAVEQNLLGFSAGLVQAVCKNRSFLFNARVVDHLDQFVNKVES